MFLIVILGRIFFINFVQLRIKKKPTNLGIVFCHCKTSRDSNFWGGGGSPEIQTVNPCTTLQPLQRPLVATRAQARRWSVRRRLPPIFVMHALPGDFQLLHQHALQIRAQGWRATQVNLLTLTRLRKRVFGNSPLSRSVKEPQVQTCLHTRRVYTCKKS